MATNEEYLAAMKQRKRLPGAERRAVVVKTEFTDRGLLDKPRSMKAETLVEKTDGFTSAEIKQMADAIAESGKMVSAATVNKHIREIGSKLIREDISPAKTPSRKSLAKATGKPNTTKATTKKAKNNAKSDKDEVAVSADPDPTSKQEVSALKAEGKSKAQPTPRQQAKDQDTISTKPIVKSNVKAEKLPVEDSAEHRVFEKTTIELTDIVIAVDATRNMKDMENAIENGLVKIFSTVSRFDGARVRVSLLGKDSETIEQAPSSGMMPHMAFKCRGRSDVLDEFARILKKTAATQRKTPKKKRAKNTVAIVIADMSNIDKGELSAGKFKKKIRKHQSRGWQVIVSAYGLSDKDAKKRSISPDNVICFDRGDKDSVIAAFGGVAGMLEQILSGYAKKQ